MTLTVEPLTVEASSEPLKLVDEYDVVDQPSCVFSAEPMSVNGGAFSGAGIFSVPSVDPPKKRSFGHGSEPVVALNNALNVCGACDAG